MPLTKEELQKSEYYQKLQEQDRVQYLNRLENARRLQGSVTVIDDNGNNIENKQPEPLRNDAGVFLSFEDPFNEGNGLDSLDQEIKIDKKSTIYLNDPFWNNVLDREFSELWESKQV